MAQQHLSAAYLSADQKPQTLGVIIPFAILAVIAVALRLCSRQLQKIGWKIDDWFSVVSLILALGCFALSCAMVHYGSGKHIEAVDPSNFEPYLQCLFAYELIYATTILFIKLSLITFYTRIFSTRNFKIGSWIVAGVVGAWWIAVILVSIFSCDPVSGFWNKTMVPPAKCISSKDFFVGNAVPNIVTDIVIILLPVRMIWSLHMGFAQKLSLSMIFTLGGFVVVCSIIRLIEQFKVDDPDFTWAMNGTVIWTSLEVTLGVICACLPTMRPLVRWVMPKAMSSQYPGSHPPASKPMYSQKGFHSLPSSGDGQAKDFDSERDFELLGRTGESPSFEHSKA